MLEWILKYDVDVKSSPALNRTKAIESSGYGVQNGWLQACMDLLLWLSKKSAIQVGVVDYLAAAVGKIFSIIEK